MTSAFSPGHISCFFRPVVSGGPLTTGSRGVGMKSSLGAWATVEERTDGRTVVSINGERAVSSVTGAAAEMLVRGRGFDIHVTTELPVSQGFGMSAAGTVAAGLCICRICDMEDHEAYRAAHIAEVKGGGGLGDVAGILGGPVSIRTRAGLPPHGRVVGAGERTGIVLAVVGGEMRTKDILARMSERALEAGDEACRSPSPCLPDDIVRVSRRFSEAAGLETAEVSAALGKVPASAMCMLGNSIFSFLHEDDVRDALGPDAPIYACSTTDAMPFIHKE